VLFLVGPFFLFSQENDTMPYTMYKDRLVLFSDLGFNSAPFTLKDNYLLGVKKLSFKNNIKAALGIGIAYKWFGLRVGFTLPRNIKAESKFGNTNYFDVGLKFNIKQVFTSIDLRRYDGYVIKDEYKWNDSITSLTPNGIYPKVSSTSISANVWWFKSKEFNMQPVMGRVGHYNKSAKTWYFKTSLNYFGITSNDGSIAPTQLTDSTDRTNANAVGALDFGLIPGYAYVNRVNNWQFTIFGGLGGVIQSKFYATGPISRGFLGIAPRVDFRLLGGYSKPGYFVFITSDFDFKSIQIQNLSYNQAYYNVKLLVGVRIRTKKSRQESKDVKIKKRP